MIELIVCIFVISILVSLIAPAISAARESASRMTCASRLRQVGVACISYHDSYGFLPDTFRNGPSFPIDSGWGPHAKLLPYIEEQNLYMSLDFDRQTGDWVNRSILQKQVNLFACPSDGRYPQYSAYLPSLSNSVASINMVFSEPVVADHSETRIAKISDGTSNTFLGGERKIQKFGPVTLCGVLADDTAYSPDTQPTLPAIEETRPGSHVTIHGRFDSYHHGGSQFVMCDGSVRLVANEIDGAAFEAMGSPNLNDLF